MPTTNPFDTPTQCKDDSLAKNNSRRRAAAKQVSGWKTPQGKIQTPSAAANSLAFPNLTIRWYIWNSCHYVSSSLRSAGSLRCDVSTCNFYPFRYAAALFAFDINDVCIAATSAADSVLLRCIPLRPVVVFFSSCFLVCGSRLKIWFSFQLACRRIGRAMLDRCMSVSEVAEIVDVLWREKCTGSEGVDGRVTPLCTGQLMCEM